MSTATASKTGTSRAQWFNSGDDCEDCEVKFCRDNDYYYYYYHQETNVQRERGRRRVKQAVCPERAFWWPR